jgi:hypothetical protein
MERSYPWLWSQVAQVVLTSISLIFKPNSTPTNLTFWNQGPPIAP